MVEMLTEPGLETGIPDSMSQAAARFFAAEWEGNSFLEFFVDLQLRVSSELSGTEALLSRLSDHARYALQSTVLRAVDSYFAYLGEVYARIASYQDAVSGKPLQGRPPEGRVPADAATRFAAPLAHLNIRQLDRGFTDATGITLYPTSEHVKKIARLVSLRNLIAHGRAFASEDLAHLVPETTSVRELGLTLKATRQDFEFLRGSVLHVDAAAAERGFLAHEVTRERLFSAIAAAAHQGAAPARRKTIGD